MCRFASAVDPRVAGPLAGCSRHYPRRKLLPLWGSAALKAQAWGSIYRIPGNMPRIPRIIFWTPPFATIFIIFCTSGICVSR